MKDATAHPHLGRQEPPPLERRRVAPQPPLYPSPDYAIYPKYFPVGSPPPSSYPKAPPQPPPDPGPDDTFYPGEDGTLWPHSFDERDALVKLVNSIREHFWALKRDALVSFDNFVYYRPRDTRARIAPDVFVVLDHGYKSFYEAGVFKTWKEGKNLDLVLEALTSGWETLATHVKKEAYRQMGVSEYFLFQPDAARPGPDKENPNKRLQGFRLKGTAYREIEPKRSGSIASEVLGTSLRPVGIDVRLANQPRPFPYRSFQREVELRRAAEELALQERLARQAAEARAREAETRAQSEALARETDRKKIEWLEQQLRLRDRPRGGENSR